MASNKTGSPSRAGLVWLSPDWFGLIPFRVMRVTSFQGLKPLGGFTFPQQQCFNLGFEPRLALARSEAVQRQVRARFRRVPVQILGEVPESSGEGFRRRCIQKFRRVLAQTADEVLEDSGADS